MTAKVGLIVGYTLAEGDCNSANVGEHRPAIIVKVWDYGSGCSQLQVFMDGDGGGWNDGTPNVVWKTSINQSDDPNKPGHWHYLG